MRSGRLWASAVVLLLSAAPALAVSISPPSIDAVENSFPAKIQLNASVSGNDDGCIYLWSQTGGTPALNQTNGNGGAKHWEFTTPSVDADTSLTFRVAVTGCAAGSKNGSATAIVNVHNSISNSAPVASATVYSPAPPATIFEGDTVTVDGSASSDPDNDALTYLWEQVDGPAVTLSSTTAAKPTFIAPNNALSNTGSTLQFKLTVSDGKLFNSTNLTVNVKWLNDPPKAVLSCPEKVDERAALELSGVGSTDTDDGIATYGWIQTYGGPSVNGLPIEGTSDNISLSAPTLTSHFNKVTLELKVTDKSGAYDTTTCDVTVNDKTPPVFSNLLADITAEAQSAAGATVIYTAPTATDAVDGDRPVTCDPASGSTFALDETTTIKCSASDTSGNSVDTSFTIKVQDKTPPSFTAPGSFSTLATSASGAVVSYTTPTAHDLVDGNFLATCTPASGSAFGLGTTLVTCGATDTHGNAATIQTFNISVNYGINGLLSPYDPSKSYKIKSAIPLKWQFTSSTGAALPSAAAQATVSVYKVTDGVDDTAPIEFLADSGNSGYQYDSTTNTWQFNWKTTGLAAGKYDVYILCGVTGQKFGPYRVQLVK